MTVRRRRARPPKQIGRPDLVPDEVKACLPASGVIRDYVCWAVQETYAAPIYHLGAILPIAAYECCTLGWGGPWTLPVRGRQAALQSFLIGAPASAKSTCLRMAQQFHLDLLMRSRGSLWSESDDPWLMAEGSVPGLLEAVHDCWDEDLGVSPAIFFHEEVSSLLNKGGDVIDILMQLFDHCRSVERHLQKYRTMKKAGEKPPSKVMFPAIGGIFCGTTSSAGRTMTASHFEGGLVSRSLWFTGKPDTERYFSTKPDPQGRQTLIERWTHHGRRLTGLRLGEDASATVSELDGDCQEILQPMFDAFRTADAAGDEVRASVLQRGMGLSRTIAAIYALSRGSRQIRPSDVKAAMKLVEVSQETVEHLQSVTVENKIFRLSQKALERIKRAGKRGITRTTLNRRHLQIDAGTLDQVVALLEESGEVHIGRTRASRRGRPTQLFLHTDHVDFKDNVIELRRRTGEDDVEDNEDGLDEAE